jgi:hypothetical protein
MEDILNLYEQPYDLLSPLITFDERPCQLIDDVLQPLPMEEGKPILMDYHYQRIILHCLYRLSKFQLNFTYKIASLIGRNIGK